MHQELTQLAGARTTRSMRSLALTIALGGALLAPSTAHADLILDQSGDLASSPFYRSIALQGITYDGGPDNYFAISNGIDFFGNTGPRVNTSVSGTASQNGATMYANGQAIYNGFYSSKNSVSMTVDNASAADGYYVVAGQGTRTKVEFFTPDALAARSTFTWRVTGTETAPYGQATSRIDFLAGFYGDQDWNYLFTSGQAMTEFGPGTYTYNLAGTLNQPIDLYFWSAAFAEVDRGQAPQGASFTSFANYGSTYELVGIQLYDTNDQLITNWSMVDLTTNQTVFNQNGRIDAAAPVPEPATCILLGTGLLGVARLRRHRPRRDDAGTIQAGTV
jgi:hypothetical protein